MTKTVKLLKLDTSFLGKEQLQLPSNAIILDCLYQDNEVYILVEIEDMEYDDIDSVAQMPFSFKLLSTNPHTEDSSILQEKMTLKYTYLGHIKEISRVVFYKKG